MQNASPPCSDPDQCKKPWVLFPNNEAAFRLWSVANMTRGYTATMERMTPNRLSPSDIKAVCEGMTAPEEFEKVITIEYIAYPKVVKDHGPKS